MQCDLFVTEQDLVPAGVEWARGAGRLIAPAIGATRDQALKMATRFGNRALRRALLFGATVALTQIDWDTYGFQGWSLAGSVFDFFGGFILGGFEWVLDAAKWAAAKVGDFLTSALNVLQATLHNLLDSIFGTLDYILDKAIKVATDLVDFGVKVAGDIAGAVDHVLGIVNGLISDAISVVYETLGPIVEGLIRTALNGVESLFFTLINGARDLALGAVAELRDLVWPAINDILGRLQDMAGFGWDVFWQLFWPEVARQLGVPEDPLDVLRGAWWLLKLARDFATGDFRDAMEAFASGAYSYATGRVEDMAQEQWDLLEPIMRAAVGLTP